MLQPCTTSKSSAHIAECNVITFPTTVLTTKSSGLPMVRLRSAMPGRARQSGHSPDDHHFRGLSPSLARMSFVASTLIASPSLPPREALLGSLGGGGGSLLLLSFAPRSSLLGLSSLCRGLSLSLLLSVCCRSLSRSRSRSLCLLSMEA